MQRNGAGLLVKVEQYRDPHAMNKKLTLPLQLNSEQKVALDQVTKSIKDQQSRTFLLEGVTGSGKQKSICKQSLMRWRKIKRLLCWFQKLL